MNRQEEREQAFLDHGGDCFAIYQIKAGDDTRDIHFQSMDWLQSIGCTVERNNYDSWADAEKRLRQLIEEGRYLTPEEMEQYKVLADQGRIERRSTRQSNPHRQRAWQNAGAVDSGKSPA